MAAVITTVSALEMQLRYAHATAATVLLAQENVFLSIIVILATEGVNINA